MIDIIYKKSYQYSSDRIKIYSRAIGNNIFSCYGYFQYLDERYRFNIYIEDNILTVRINDEVKFSMNATSECFQTSIERIERIILGGKNGRIDQRNSILQFAR